MVTSWNERLPVFAVIVVFLSCFIFPSVASAEWSVEVVENGGYLGYAGFDSSIAVDSWGHSHISYRFYDPLNRSWLKYATNAFGSWQIETVDDTTWIEGHTSMVVDFSGHAYISYHDFTNNDLKCATNVSGSWHTAIVDSAGDAGLSSAVDSFDHIHIGYIDGSTGFLKHATNASGSWQIEIVSDAGPAQEPSIAVDSSGHVHMCYLDSNRYPIYVTNTSGSWQSETVGSQANVGSPSIAVDSSDHAHIAFFTVEVPINNYVKHATNESGSWQIETVSTHGIYPDIAVDSFDHVHIAYVYYDGDLEYLQYATNASGSWRNQRVPGAQSYSSLTPSIAADSSNYVHISYLDLGNASLMYAAQVPLSRIDLVAPADLSTLSAPPTFSWSTVGGANTVFSVEMALTPDGPFYSTWQLLRAPIRGTTLTLPLSVWNRLPTGQPVYLACARNRLIQGTSRGHQ